MEWWKLVLIFLGSVALGAAVVYVWIMYLFGKNMRW